MDILEYMMKLSKINGNVIKEEVSNIIENDDDLIVKKNRKQLSKGLNRYGNVIGTYSKKTQNISEDYKFHGVPKPNKKKIAGANYNFNWTGKYLDSITSKVNDIGKDLQVEIYSTDKRLIDFTHTRTIDDVYRFSLGLTDNSKSDVYNYLNIGIIEFINLKTKK